MSCLQRGHATCRSPVLRHRPGNSAACGEAGTGTQSVKLLRLQLLRSGLCTLPFQALGVHYAPTPAVRWFPLPSVLGLAGASAESSGFRLPTHTHREGFVGCYQAAGKQERAMRRGALVLSSLATGIIHPEVLVMGKGCEASGRPAEGMSVCSSLGPRACIPGKEHLLKEFG